MTVMTPVLHDLYWLPLYIMQIVHTKKYGARRFSYALITLHSEHVDNFKERFKNIFSSYNFTKVYSLFCLQCYQHV